MRQKIIKAGNSLAVVVPAKFIKRLGIRKGDWVELKLQISRNKIIYTFSGVQQLSLEDTLFSHIQTSHLDKISSKMI